MYYVPIGDHQRNSVGDGVVRCLGPRRTVALQLPLAFREWEPHCFLGTEAASGISKMKHFLDLRCVFFWYSFGDLSLKTSCWKLFDVWRLICWQLFCICQLVALSSILGVVLSLPRLHAKLWEPRRFEKAVFGRKPCTTLSLTHFRVGEKKISADFTSEYHLVPPCTIPFPCFGGFLKSGYPGTIIRL